MLLSPVCGISVCLSTRICLSIQQWSCCSFIIFCNLHTAIYGGSYFVVSQSDGMVVADDADADDDEEAIICVFMYLGLLSCILF